MNESIWFSELNKPMSERKQFEKAAHDLRMCYESFVKVGFTSKQALEIVCTMVSASVGTNNNKV